MNTGQVCEQDVGEPTPAGQLLVLHLLGLLLILDSTKPLHQTHTTATPYLLSWRSWSEGGGAGLLLWFAEPP